MLRRGNSTIRTIALLAAVLMAAPSILAVEPGTNLAGEATSMQHSGVMKQVGDLGLFRLADDASISAPMLNLRAASVWGYYFDYSVEKVELIGINESAKLEKPVLAPSLFIGSEDQPLTKFNLDSLGARPEFDVRVSRVDDDSTIRSLVRGDSAYNTIRTAQLVPSPDGLVEDDGEDGDSQANERTHTFLRRTIMKPTVKTEAIGGVLDAHIKGNFILEIKGPFVKFDAANSEQVRLETGTIEQARPGDLAMESRVLHLRLFVTNGDLRLRQDGPNHVAQWVSEQVSVEGDDGLVLLNGLSLNAASQIQYEDGYTGILTPEPKRIMDLELSRNKDLDAAPASTWFKPVGFNAWPLVIAALAGAAVAAVMVFRSKRSAPPLEFMEQALEAGAFTRAARLATRILRDDPTRESAHLGRAIAFSRTGQPERVVRNLESYLDGHDPSDGTLHYVLGLAYRDMGKDANAKSALAEAVKRTPALADQVPGYTAAPLPAMPAVLENDAHGYT